MRAWELKEIRDVVWITAVRPEDVSQPLLKPGSILLISS